MNTKNKYLFILISITIFASCKVDSTCNVCKSSIINGIQPGKTLNEINTLYENGIEYAYIEENGLSGYVVIDTIACNPRIFLYFSHDKNQLKLITIKYKDYSNTDCIETAINNFNKCHGHNLTKLIRNNYSILETNTHDNCFQVLLTEHDEVDFNIVSSAWLFIGFREYRSIVPSL